MAIDDTGSLEQRVSEVQGSLLAMECFVTALSEALSPEQRTLVQAFYASETVAFRTALMNSTAPEAMVAAFERDVQRAVGLIGEPAAGDEPA